MDLKLAASVPYSSPVLLDRPRQSGSEEAAPLAWRALRLVSTGRRKGHPSLTLPRRAPARSGLVSDLCWSGRRARPGAEAVASLASRRGRMMVAPGERQGGAGGGIWWAPGIGAFTPGDAGSRGERVFFGKPPAAPRPPACSSLPRPSC